MGVQTVGVDQRPERSPNTIRANEQESARTRPAVQIRPHGRRRHRALHGELLALSRDRFHRAVASAERCPAAARRLADSLCGPRAVLHEGRVGDRRLRSRGCEPVRPAAIAAVSRCRPCRSSRRASCSSAARGSSDGIPAPAPMAIASEAVSRARRVHIAASASSSAVNGREVQHARDDDSRSRRDRPVRDPAEQLRPEGRDQRCRAGHRREVLRWPASREIIQRAKAVVLCANGAETPRLLLMSSSNLVSLRDSRTGSGMVGTNIMFNGSAIGGGLFEHEVNGYKGAVVSRILHDFYELGEEAGAIGGGGIDFRHDLPPVAFAMEGLGPTAPKWGSDYKTLLRAVVHAVGLRVRAHHAAAGADQRGLARSRPCATRGVSRRSGSHSRRIPTIARWRPSSPPASASCSMPPAQRPVDVSNGRRDVSRVPSARDVPNGHRCASSVVDKFHRAHDVPNLFIVDGSSFVTSGRGQPTMTIQALAFRAGEHIAAAARRGEI